MTNVEKHKLLTGGVAQLGEHLLCTQGVAGSIPVISTKVVFDNLEVVENSIEAIWWTKMRRKKSAYSVMFGVTEVSPVIVTNVEVKGNYQTLAFS